MAAQSSPYQNKETDCRCLVGEQEAAGLLLCSEKLLRALKMSMRQNVCA